ncbi:MAG: magnesium transporter CorA family protein [Candidatus Harrisonbacteria bacterium]|nr:magnesium transporter CorA family protein [Candidatus Harrisonbacteria bacterium]
MPALEERQRFEKGSLIEVIGPSEEEMVHLHKELGLDPGLVRDALDPYESPRLEQAHGSTYIFARFPMKSDAGAMSTVPFMIVLSNNFVALVSKEKTPLIEALSQYEDDLASTQRVKLVLQMLGQSNRRYEHYLQEAEHQINSLHVQAKRERISNEEIMRFISFEETMDDFINSLIPQNAVYHNLLSGKTIELFNEDKELIEGLILHSEELTALAKTALRSSINIRNAYSTVLGNSLNRIIKFFTSLTIILTVAVIIPSIYGMNVDLPLQSSPGAFWIILAITAAISIFLVWIFNKKRWL